MEDYHATCREFSWEVPSTFNFGGDVVDAWAAEPERPALIWCNEQGLERRFTFSEIRSASNRLANLLRENGVGKGDRVLVMLPRIPEWQIAMVGCCKLGAVPVPCITMQTAHDIAFRSHLRRIPLGIFCIPHGKSIVVLCHGTGKLCPSFFEQISPFISIEFLGRK